MKNYLSQLKERHARKKALSKIYQVGDVVIARKNPNKTFGGKWAPVKNAEGLWEKTGV